MNDNKSNGKKKEKRETPTTLPETTGADLSVLKGIGTMTTEWRAKKD